MNIIYSLSDKLGSHLIQYVNFDKLDDRYTKQDIEQLISFYFENIFFLILWLIPLFWVAHLLSIKSLVAVYIITFLPIRKTFGGWHAPNDFICTLISIIVPISLVLFGTAIMVPFKLQIIAYLFALYTIITKGVVDSPKEPIKKERKAKLKHLFMII